MVEFVGGWVEGGGVAVHLGVECTITFRIISENKQLYELKLNITQRLRYLIILMFTVKPCTKIN